MGGGGSKPAPAPTVIEDAPPAGSGRSSVVYGNNPGGPRLDGISRALANECDGCSLEVVSGISSSSVKVSRTYGSVSFAQCQTYADAKKQVENRQMSFQDFLGQLQSGKYFRNLDNGYCEQVQLSSEDAGKVTNIGEADGKVKTFRIQKASSGGFSAETKAVFTPSIPFQIKFGAKGGVVDIPVTNMTLYHPCPLRLEGIQPDAVLSLNDPSIEGAGYVVLVPLIGKNDRSSSIEFLQKIMSQVVTVSEPDPSTGAYISRDIPTGANWTLSKLFATRAGAGTNLEVLNGFYSWEGMPALERVKEDIFYEGQFGMRVPTGVRYKWVPSGRPAPKYIMLDTPVACNPADLAVLTSRMPVTPPEDAIHAVLYSSNPFQRGIVHRPCAIGNQTTRESFTDLQGVTEESCDPWTTWAQTSKGKGYTTQQIFELMFNLMVGVAMAVGAFLAFAAVLRMYDVEAADFSKGIGKITAVFFKNLQQKAASVKNTISNLKNPKQAIISNLEQRL